METIEMKTAPILHVTCTDKKGNTYPDLFITTLEESIAFIRNDYDALEAVRKRLLQLTYVVSDSQAKLRYPKKVREANREEKAGRP